MYEKKIKELEQNHINYKDKAEAQLNQKVKDFEQNIQSLNSNLSKVNEELKKKDQFYTN